MWSRSQEFLSTLNGIAQSEIGSYTAAAWQSWYNTWTNYVCYGTLPPSLEHPPHRPNN
jgi:hypothetical protein